MDPVISVEGISKRYKLGVINRNTFRDELAFRWHKFRGRDPAEYVGKLGNSHTAGKDEFWALRNVSFDVAEGEVVGLIGGNGAGKSTILKILTRITEPTSGRAVIHGRTGSLLEVGTGFHPELTGRENIYMNGTILGMKRHEIASKFDEIVDFSGVEQFLDTPVKRYSSGMYVRLAFAVAAHLEPEVLLIDEVLAVGDASFQKKCLGKMDEISRGGRTIIFVSHNMSAIQSLCHRCVWLQDGEVVRQGPVDEVVEQYMQAQITLSMGQKLADRTDRSGTGEVKASDLTAEFDHDKNTWVVKLAYESDLKDWNEARILISIRRTTGEFFTELNSLNIKEFAKNRRANGKVEITLSPDVLPSPGEYICNVALISDNTLLDHVVDAHVFTVSLETVAEWNRITSTKGICYVKQSWRSIDA